MLLGPKYEWTDDIVSRLVAKIEAKTQFRQKGVIGNQNRILEVFTFCAFFFCKTRRQCGLAERRRKVVRMRP